MKFSAQQLRALARQADVSEKSARRLLSSVYVAVSPSEELEESVELDTRRYAIGLRITTDSDLTVHNNDQVISALVAILREYGRNCPLVFTWLKRGDFDPHTLPEKLDRGSLLHASRTAGRLRAKFVRMLRE